jgi:hypothetical protein
MQEQGANQLACLGTKQTTRIETNQSVWYLTNVPVIFRLLTS